MRINEKLQNHLAITVTLNPALDITNYIRELTYQNVNVVDSSTLNAGGKGINVSKTLKNLGVRTIATGILPNGGVSLFYDQLQNEEIMHDFVTVENGNIRQNIKIIAQSGELTEINQKGAEVSKENCQAFIDKLRKYIPQMTALALCGSLAPGIPENYYSQLLKMVKTQPIITALDTKGDVLATTLKESSPQLLHLNKQELTNIGVPFEANKLHEWLCDNKIMWLVASDGKDHGWGITENETYHFVPPQLSVKSAVAAGDALLGALLFQVLERKSFGDALRFAIAFASATTQCSGSSVATEIMAHTLIEKVKLTRIK